MTVKVYLVISLRAIENERRIEIEHYLHLITDARVPTGAVVFAVDLGHIAVETQLIAGGGLVSLADLGDAAPGLDAVDRAVAAGAGLRIS